ncbi:MAG: hypothetical protein V7K88_07415, partial [Nostoc sp.]
MVSTYLGSARHKSLNQVSGRELSVPLLLSKLRVASRREVETRQHRYFFHQKSPKDSLTELKDSFTELKDSFTELKDSFTELKDSFTELKDSFTELKDS